MISMGKITFAISTRVLSLCRIWGAAALVRFKLVSLLVINWQAEMLDRVLFCLCHGG